MHLVTGHLSVLPPGVRAEVARVAALIIERAARAGDGRFGATPFVDGIRINAGWTEVLTALIDHFHLVVHGPTARALGDLPGVTLVPGKDGGSFYPSVPGSLLAEVQYDPPEAFAATIDALTPAVERAVDLAARRPAGRGVRAGHRQQLVREIASLVGRPLPSPNFEDPEEAIRDQSALMEGALRSVVGSEYERNPAARAACLAHHGYACAVCGFSFEAVYGPLGRGFIHVHHVVPLSERGGEYRVDPVADLVPVCPNCHAMLHRTDPPMQVQDLRNLIISRPGLVGR